MQVVAPSFHHSLGPFGRFAQDRALELYAAGLALAALLVAGALVATGAGSGPLWALVALSALSAVGEEGRVRLSRTVEFSISLLPTLFAAVAFGPLAAMIVAAASMIGEARRDRLKWVVYTSSEALTGALTGFAASSFTDGPASSFGAIALATAAGTAVSQASDFGFALVIAKLRRALRARDLVSMLAPMIGASLPLYVPVVALLAYSYWQISPWTLPLFLVPTLAAQRLFILYQEQRELTGELTVANDRLERANLSFATALVATLDARDKYTAGHSASVAMYARDIAERMGLPPEEQSLAHVCGLVHDIGKVGLPVGLLEKQGPLTLSERRVMEEHSEIGERILENVDDYSEIAKIVRAHHERVDGHGYPDKLVGSEIPLVSRIIAVADAYDAMISDRPYRDAMPSRVARLRLAQAADSQFDTAVVAAFEAILAGARETYRGGRISTESPAAVHDEQAILPTYLVGS